MRAMTVARMGGMGGWDMAATARGEGAWPLTAGLAKVRHGRRSRHPQTHPRLAVRPRRARAGALLRQRLQPVRPSLWRTVAALAADQPWRRGRAALPLALWWLGGSATSEPAPCRSTTLASASAPIHTFWNCARPTIEPRQRINARANAVPWKLQTPLHPSKMKVTSIVLLRQFLSNTLKSRGFLAHYAFP
jgi:hypothetical protein